MTPSTANPAQPALRGLYVITDEHLMNDHTFETMVAQAIDGGARLVQYRDKHSPAARRRRQATALAHLCRARNVLLIVNDDIELAAAVNAHGVHLGKDDPALDHARRELGNQAIIGVSCYNQLDRALAAQQAGADYVAFGRFFVSPTKPDAVPATLDLLRTARERLGLPIAAIGGITPENGASLVQAGADMLAVISGVFGQPDIADAARRYAALFDTGD
jgi:thiamine-phosphate pyrophosphorylase